MIDKATQELVTLGIAIFGAAELGRPYDPKSVETVRRAAACTVQSFLDGYEAFVGTPPRQQLCKINGAFVPAE